MRRILVLAVLGLALAGAVEGKKCTITGGSSTVCIKSWGGGNGDFEVRTLGASATSVLLEMDIGGGYRAVAVRTDRGGQADCDHTAAGQFCTFVAPRGAFLRVTVTGGTADTVVDFSSNDWASVFELQSVSQIADLGCADLEFIQWDDGGGTWQCAAAGGSSNAISQLDSNVTVTDTGSDGEVTVDTDGVERVKVDNVGRMFLTQGLQATSGLYLGPATTDWMWRHDSATGELTAGQNTTEHFRLSTSQLKFKSSSGPYITTTSGGLAVASFGVLASTAGIGADPTAGSLVFGAASVGQWNASGISVVDGLALELPQSTVAPTAAESKVFYDEDPNALAFYDGTQWHELAQVHGGIEVEGNVTTTTISVASTPVQVTVFDTNSPANAATPDHTNDHVTVPVAGDYQLSASCSIDSVAGAGSLMQLSIEANNGATTLCTHPRNLSGGGGENGSVTIVCPRTLAANDTVELWISNETNTANYVVEYCYLSLRRL